MNAVEKLEWVERVLTDIAQNENDAKRIWLYIHDVRDNVGDWLATHNSMSPDYPALAAHEPTSGIEDSRAAGLDGGGPFVATITTLPHRVHGCEKGCECSECRNMQKVFARGDALRQVETF